MSDLIERLGRAADSIKPEPGMGGPHGGHIGGITRQKAVDAIEDAMEALAARDRPGLDVEGIRAAVEAAHPEPKYKDDSRGEGWTWHGIKRGREHVYEALAEAQQREGAGE